jgi:hypothetical protein
VDEKEREALARFLVGFRNSLVDIVEQINEFLDETVPKKGFATNLVGPSGDVLAEIFESPTEVKFEIAPTHMIPVNDLTVQNFLIKKVLNKIKEKGLNYHVEDEGGKLKSITVEGPVTHEDMDTLRKTIAWTILKVETRGGGSGA